MSDSPWELVAECFDTDDGSLPGIFVNGLSVQGVSAIYAMLRSRSRLAGELTPEFWSITEHKALLVDAVPDAAALVASGKAEPFHLCIQGVIAAGVTLPALGVFVWQEAIELDYRMGVAWGAPEVKGFFELLWDCCTIDPGAVIAPAECEGPPYPERFTQAWLTYAEAKAIESGAAPDD